MFHRIESGTYEQTDLYKIRWIIERVAKGQWAFKNNLVPYFSSLCPNNAPTKKEAENLYLEHCKNRERLSVQSFGKRRGVEIAVGKLVLLRPLDSIGTITKIVVFDDPRMTYKYAAYEVTLPADENCKDGRSFWVDFDRIKEVA